MTCLHFDYRVDQQNGSPVSERENLDSESRLFISWPCTYYQQPPVSICELDALQFTTIWWETRQLPTFSKTKNFADQSPWNFPQTTPSRGMCTICLFFFDCCRMTKAFVKSVLRMSNWSGGNPAAGQPSGPEWTWLLRPALRGLQGVWTAWQTTQTLPGPGSQPG